MMGACRTSVELARSNMLFVVCLPLIMESGMICKRGANETRARRSPPDEGVSDWDASIMDALGTTSEGDD